MDEHPDAAEWVLRSMVAMAASDGKLDEREIALIQQTYHDLTARSVAREDIDKACNKNAKCAEFAAELASESPLLSLATKEEIVRGVYFVLLADEQITTEEDARLEQIVAALGVSESEYKVMLDDLAIALASRIR